MITYYDYDDMRNLTLRTTDAAVASDADASDPNYAIDDSIVERFTHDGLGRMLTAYKMLDANDVSLVEFAYNDLGKIMDFDQTLFGGTERQIDYTYDQFGFLEATDYPDGSTTIDRTNDWRGRIDTLSRSATELVDYDYVGARVANRDYSVPNVGVAFDYDNLGWVTDIDYGASVVSFDYSYVSNENNIYRKTFDHRGGGPYNEYTYDDFVRLTVFVITVRIVRLLIWRMLTIELVIGLCGRKGCVIFEYSNGNGEDKIKKTRGRPKNSTNKCTVDI